MALTTLSAVPSATYAGDTLLWSLYFSDYPASGSWSMDFSFRAPGGSEIDLDSAQDGSTANHLVSVAAVTTAGWVPMTYTGVGRCKYGTGDSQEVVTVWRGTLEVKAELNAQPDNYDSRSWAKRCLDKIEAVIEGRASKDVLNSTIAGQTLGRMTPEQLLLMRDRFKSEYDFEELALSGKTNNVLTTFVAP